jgi:hypothetical protein
MLKLMSRFVLEVLPYMLSALIAAIVVPGFLMSQFHGNQPAGASNSADGTIRALELMHGDHAPFAPDKRSLAGPPVLWTS